MPLEINHAFLGHRGAIYTLHPLEHDSHFLSGGSDGWLVKWDLNQPDLGVKIANIPGQILSICYLPMSNSCVVGDLNGVVYWIDLNRPEQTPVAFAHHKKGVFSILHIGEFVFTAGGDGFFTKWSVSLQLPQESLRVSFTSIRTVIYDQEQNEFALGCSDGAIYFIQKDTFQVTNSWENCHVPSVFTLAFHPDRKRCISGGRDALLKIWNRSDGHLLQVIPAHQFTINHLVLDHEGNLLFTASRDKSIRILNTHNFELVTSLKGPLGKGHQNSVNRLIWFESQKLLLSAGDDRQIINWKLRNP